MLILGIDLEGMNENLIEKGINIHTDRITEIGAVLWDTRINSPVRFFSELINERDCPPLSDEVIELTGIDRQLLDEYGLKDEEIKMSLERLSLLIGKSSYLMAHNGERYDKPMLTAIYERFNLKMPEKIWIDTLFDIEYPKKITYRSMAALEHSHNFINPFTHRAVTDVLSMLKIASHYDYERMALLASSPKLKIIATLEAPNWKNSKQVEKFNQIKSKVSRAKFTWDPSNKEWFKYIHKIHLDEGSLQYNFDWKIS